MYLNTLKSQVQLFIKFYIIVYNNKIYFILYNSFIFSLINILIIQIVI